MSARPRIRRAPAAIALLGALAVAGGVADAAIQGGGAAKVPLLLVGADEDSVDTPGIQPPDATVDQSVRKADTLGGGEASDTLIGRLGSDVIVAGPGDDVMVGGPEAGSDTTRFPNSDQALGGPGNDVFVWSPGDGNDAYSGGEPPPTTTETRNVTRSVVRGGRRVRVTVPRTVTVPSPPDDDVLVLGTMALTPGDDSMPLLAPAGPGQPIPRVNVSGAGLPATVGTSPPLPTVRGFCRLDPAPAVSNWDFLVRFINQATRQVVATVRIRSVERVLCRTDGADSITEIRLGPKGAGPPVARAGFTPPPGTRLDALVD